MKGSEECLNHIIKGQQGQRMPEWQDHIHAPEMIGILTTYETQRRLLETPNGSKVAGSHINQVKEMTSHEA